MSRRRRSVDSMSALEMAKLPAAELRELARTGGAPLAAYKGAADLERGRNPVDAVEEEAGEHATELLDARAEERREHRHE